MQKKLWVRKMAESDISFVVNYWLSASPEDLARMGVDPAKIPGEKNFSEQLRNHLFAKDPTASYLIWMRDEERLGYSSLKNIVRGEKGEIHLHMVAAPQRGAGQGGQFFCLSVLEFFQEFSLREMHCEPRASNPFPNGMLRKIGFPLEKTYLGSSSDLSAECELNRYKILPELAKRYLELPRPTP